MVTYSMWIVTVALLPQDSDSLFKSENIGLRLWLGVGVPACWAALFLAICNQRNQNSVTLLDWARNTTKSGLSKLRYWNLTPDNLYSTK